ncbi:hypothetical protein, partial [Klebsiella pneumoniae]|uniref:hypothetical protein n=1 Tax=Klebsiella pneumoniae TaxID=573 RepID=UPI001C6F797F
TTASFVSGEYFGLAIKLHLTQLGVQLLGCSPAAPPGNPDDCILSAVWAAPRGGFFMSLRGTNHQNNLSIWPILSLLSR